MRLRDRFLAFAETIPDLPLYARLARAVAGDDEVSELLTAARPGQARPVLLFAAVHDHVLRNPDVELARWYRSVTPADEVPGDDPWPTFRATCLEHRAELVEVIATRATQTNEVNRAVLLAPLVAAACADVPGAAVSLVELGASAGLLLGLDRYRIEVGGVTVGAEESPVRLAGDVRSGTQPDLEGFPPAITERVGIDVDPVPLDDADRVRWLEACLWPDQPWRIERFRAAVDLARVDPPRLVAGDLIGGLPHVVDSVARETHLVVFDTWVLTYVERERRQQVADILEAAAASGRPVSWLSAEPPGCVPGVEAPAWGPVEGDPVGGDTDGRSRTEGTAPDTVLGLRCWRDGREVEPVAPGWAHPHGNWLTWNISGRRPARPGTVQLR